MEITQRDYNVIDSIINSQIDLIQYYKMWSKRLKNLQYIKEEQDMVLGMVVSGVDQEIQTRYTRIKGKPVPSELQGAIIKRLYYRMHEIKDKLS
ncbi:MAG: hypothetical protein OXP12_06865 [Thaumarchaeota archaeon]|nr:hypothetical protein [Nitrososphaerota archaeon]MDE0266747.1 hypothetical protein [Nitrososphaerota archaeon]